MFLKFELRTDRLDDELIGAALDFAVSVLAELLGREICRLSVD